MLEKKTIKLVLSVLRKSKHSLTIEDISRLTKLHRVTAAKYLAVLEAIGNVKMRRVGKAKLFLLRGRNEK